MKNKQKPMNDSNMNELRDDHTQWSKSQRERQTPYHIAYIWNLKYDTNELIYEAETDSQRTDWWLPRGKGLWEGWRGSLGLADASYYL